MEKEIIEQIDDINHIKNEDNELSSYLSIKYASILCDIILSSDSKEHYDIQIKLFF